MVRRGKWKAVLGGMIVVLAVPAASLTGQEGAWHLTATAAQTWFSGGLADTTTTDGNWGLAPKVTWGITADRAVGKVRLGLGLSYVSSHVQVSGEQVTLIESTLDVRQVGIAALVTVPLIRLGGAGAAVRLSAGPMLGVWSLTDADARTRVGGTATLQLTAPITTSWHLLATLGGSVSGSPFNPDDVPDFFETTTLWATAAGLGIQYAF